MQTMGPPAQSGTREAAGPAQMEGVHSRASSEGSDGSTGRHREGHEGESRMSPQEAAAANKDPQAGLDHFANQTTEGGEGESQGNGETGEPQGDERAEASPTLEELANQEISQSPYTDSIYGPENAWDTQQGQAELPWGNKMRELSADVEKHMGAENFDPNEPMPEFKERADTLLQQMVDAGAITEDQKNKLKDEFVKRFDKQKENALKSYKELKEKVAATQNLGTIALFAASGAIAVYSGSPALLALGAMGSLKRMANYWQTPEGRELSRHNEYVRKFQDEMQTFVTAGKEAEMLDLLDNLMKEVGENPNNETFAVIMQKYQGQYNQILQSLKEGIAQKVDETYRPPQ